MFCLGSVSLSSLERNVLGIKVTMGCLADGSLCKVLPPKTQLQPLPQSLSSDKANEEVAMVACRYGLPGVGETSDVSYYGKAPRLVKQVVAWALLVLR